jgi:eukaryotic-like serine/threonine-protein kinase
LLAEADSAVALSPAVNVTGNEKVKLQRRAARIARLRHPNLMRMLPMPGGAGYTPVLHQGRQLSELLRGTPRMEPEQLARVLLDVLCGLSALHGDIEDGRRFVHGEVSPQHVFVGSDGIARLVPILSRHVLIDAAPSANGCAAPELLRGERPDPRADLFSVGVMLWEALAGAPLFPDPSARGVAGRLDSPKLPPLGALPDNHWARPLCALAERAISPYPVLRFQTAIEFSNALGAALATCPSQPCDWHEEAPTLVGVPRPRLRGPRSITPMSSVLDVAASLSDTEPAADSTAPIEAQRRPTSSKSRRGRVVIAVGALAAAAALSLSMGASRHRSAATTTVPASTPAEPRQQLPTVPSQHTAAAALPSASTAPAVPSASAAAKHDARGAAPKRRREHAPRAAEDYGI